MDGVDCVDGVSQGRVVRVDGVDGGWKGHVAHSAPAEEGVKGISRAAGEPVSRSGKAGVNGTPGIASEPV